MSSLVLDLFVEDRAHELFLAAMIRRVAREEGREIEIRVRAARGGHGRAIGELRTYIRLVEKGSVTLPDVIVIAIDANCKPHAQARREIQDSVVTLLQSRAVIACPDPHIERWYLADPVSFCQVVGKQPVPGKKKCRRDWYKELLVGTIRSAGISPILGGLEFAPEIVEAMDLYRAGQNDRALGQFIDDLRATIRLLAQ